MLQRGVRVYALGKVRYNSALRINGHNFQDLFLKGNSKLEVNLGKQLSLHWGSIGHLADSSVVCKYGNTVIHVAISSKRVDNPTKDFLPLTVDFRNRMYGHGSIPNHGSRREKGSTDEEILAARIIDRSIRSLFPKGYIRDIQCTVTAHSVDNEGGDPIVARYCVSYCCFEMIDINNFCVV